MARPSGSSFRLPLPFLFLFLPAVLVAALLAGAVVPNTPNNQQPSLLVLAVGDGDFESLAAQEGSSAPTRGNMDIIFVAEPSPARCDITSCKKVCSSSTTTTPTLLQSMDNSHGSVKSSPKLRYFCISTFNLPEEFLASIFVEVGFLARWFVRRQCSSPLQCAWVPPLLYLYWGTLFFTGWCTWSPQKSTWSDGCLFSHGRVGALRVRHAHTGCGCCSNLGAENLKVEGIITKGRSFMSLFCTLLAGKHGSGNAFLDVRADLRLQSMLVLRFNEERSRTKFLSLVKAIRYLRLKILNPHRHRPVRQPRGAPAVLSECNKEDPRCFWRGHLSSTAQRPCQRHHLCLLCERCRIQIFRLSCTLEYERFYLSLSFDSPVVAQKLQLCLGWKIPPLCTLVLSS